MHADPTAEALPLTTENLESKREGFGQNWETGAAAATPRHFVVPDVPSTAVGSVVPPEFVLIGRFKTIVNEVLTCLGSQGNTYDIDDYIAVAQECLQSLKTLKLDRRIESRRSNTMRQASNSVGAPPPYVPASPAAGDDNNNDERSTTPGPTSYMAALMRQKRSPKRSPFRAEVKTRDEVEAARQASALRSEERQRLAEERRMDRLQELKLKSEAAEAREQQVKARREEAEMRQRIEAEDRVENGRRRAEEARKMTVEKAQKAHVRVDEVRLGNELRQQTKAILIDQKMSDIEQNQEAKREARRARVQERNGAMEAAAERRRNLSEERIERQKERDRQRQDKLRRIEEQKKAEQEQLLQRAEEWEKKLHRHQQETSEEAETLMKKAEEKMQQSAQLLEEQREKRRAKLEREEQKSNEAKVRREVETEVKPTLQQFVPPLSPQEEDQQLQRIAKLVTVSARQGKTFADNYQKESQCSLKDLNRSKLRAAFSRLSNAMASPTPVAAQCRQPLHDLLSTSMTEMDHEFVRYFNQFEVLIKVLSEARKAREASIVRLVSEFLLMVFINEGEGKASVSYFVRSGNTVALATCVRDELKVARQHSNNDMLRWMLSVVGVCLERLTKETARSGFTQVRDQLLADMDTMGLDRLCLAIVRMNPNEDDLELVYCALCILNIAMGVYSKRKGDVMASWFEGTVASLFSLLQDILNPGGVPLSRDRRETLSCARVTVLFCVFRTLNILARWQLAAFQAVLHDAPVVSNAAAAKGVVVTLTTAQAQEQKLREDSSNETAAKPDAPVIPVRVSRHELFHILNSFFTYIHDHSDELETIPSLSLSDISGSAASNANSNKPSEAGRGPAGAFTSSVPLSTTQAAAQSFDNALRYGLTLTSIPAFPSVDHSSAGGAGAREGLQPGGRNYPLRAALHECILLVGYLCLEDSALQEMLGWGEKKTLLGNILHALPAPYFSNAQHILFPTILAAISDSDRNMFVVQTEMDPSLLHTFITGEFNTLSRGAKAYAVEHSKQIYQYRIETDTKHAIRHSMSLVKGKNWADMSESEDALLDARTSHSTDTNSTTPAMEKDKLCKMFRASGTAAHSFPGFYKLDRRMPISYWPALIDQLETILSRS